MKKLTVVMLLLGSILTLQGCVAYSYVTTGSIRPWYAGGQIKKNENIQEYNQTTDARLRLYGQNNIATVAYENTECTPNSTSKMIEVGASLLDASQTAFGKAKSSTIGMSRTEFSEKALTNNKILFKEWVTKANSPVTVQLLSDIHLDNSSNLCSLAGYFTPIPSEEYEVKGIRNYNSCQIKVDRIQKNDDGSVSLETVPLTRCQKVATNQSLKRRSKDIFNLLLMH